MAAQCVSYKTLFRAAQSSICASTGRYRCLPGVHRLEEQGANVFQLLMPRGPPVSSYQHSGSWRARKHKPLAAAAIEEQKYLRKARNGNVWIQHVSRHARHTASIDGAYALADASKSGQVLYETERALGTSITRWTTQSPSLCALIDHITRT